MKNLLLALSLGIASLGLASHAQASTVAAVNGGTFDFFNDINGTIITWDSTYTPFGSNGVIEYDNGDGTIDDVAAGVVRITGASNGLGPSFTQMTTKNNEAYAINVSFDWSFATNDAPYDPLVFIRDLLSLDPADFVEVTSTGGTMGNAIFQVASMAIWGFSIDSVDGLFGAGIAEISNLQFTQAITPSPVPLPPALLLFGAAMFGLGFVRNRKQEAA